MNWLKDRWHSVPLQIIALTVLPLTILLFAIAVGSLSLHRQAMRELVGERDARATQAAAAAMTEQLNFRLTAVRSLARQANSDKDPNHILTDAAYFLPDFEGGLALFTPDGSLIQSTGDTPFWQSATVQAELNRIRQSPDFQRDPRSLATLAHPQTERWLTLIISTDQTDGILAVGAFSPVGLADRTLRDLFQAEGVAAAFLVDANGRLLYQTGNLPYTHDELPHHPGISEALQGNSGTTYLAVTDAEHVAAYSPIPPAGWALVIEEPWASVSDPLLEATEFTPFLLAPALIITLVVLWFGLRQIVQPLRKLEQQATEVGWGHYDAIEEPVGGISEIHRLQTELIHMAHKLQASQQNLRGYLGAVTTGQEEERRRLARDLHDDTIQSLIALNQRIQLAQLSGRSTPEKLSEMQQMVAQIINDLRRLTRALRPIYLEDLGLIPALDMLAKETELAADITVSCQVTGETQRLSSQTELALYRIAQEALSNITRHANATIAMISLDFAPDSLTFTIRDDGQGFAVPPSPAVMTPNGHFGLLSIQERAELIGATFTISSAPDEGTNLSLQLPLATKNIPTDKREHG